MTNYTIGSRTNSNEATTFPMPNPFDVSEQKEEKKGEGTGTTNTILNAILAVATIIALIVSVLTPSEARSLVLFTGAILVLLLAAGVAYRPTSNLVKRRQRRSRLDHTARNNITELLSLTNEFKKQTSITLANTITTTIFNIRNQQAPKPSPLAGTLDNSWAFHFQEIGTVIEGLGDRPISFDHFVKLSSLLRIAVTDFNQTISEVVLELRAYHKTVATFSIDNLQSYRDARLRYMSFLTSLEKFQEKIEIELGDRHPFMSFFFQPPVDL